MLLTFESDLRHYGVSQAGEVYLGRDYQEFLGIMFIPLRQLVNRSIQPEVLENELLPLMAAQSTHVHEIIE